MREPVSIHAREILDSRGNPTVEVEITDDLGHLARASVPSGASKGAHEAIELRDDDPGRYRGLGVQKSCQLIKEEIAPAIKGLDFVNLPEIDQRLRELDATPNKARLGANSTLAVSLAAAKLGAMKRDVALYKHLASIYSTTEIKMPTPLFNFINGGRHANNGMTIQEFMVIPPAKENFKEALRQASEIFHHLKKILELNRDSTTVGDEGGFAPSELEGPMEAMELLLTAAQESGCQDQIFLALDLASTEFYSESGYSLYPQKSPLSFQEMAAELKEWVRRFPLVSLEDPLSEDDWMGWSYLTKELSGAKDPSNGGPLLVGDDLFVTNPERLNRGIRQGAGNAILIKPNQIGSVSETAEVVALAREHGYTTIASHRSGETEDPALAHLAVGLGTDGIKTGSVSRSERLAKYNELLRIEEILGPGSYRGPQALKRKSVKIRG